MARLEIQLGTCRLEVDGIEDRRCGVGKTSVDFMFDDVLHAVQRAAGAMLVEEDFYTVQSALDHLRKRLLEKQEAREAGTDG